MARITKGTVDQFIAQVNDKIEELGGDVNSSFVYPEDLEDLENGEYESHVTEPINAATAEPTFDDILDWLSEHDQAWSDCCDYFGVNDLSSEVDEDAVMSWIFDHDRLAEDFMNHFGHSAIMDDEYDVEECDNIEVESATNAVNLDPTMDVVQANVDDDYILDFAQQISDEIYGCLPQVDGVEIAQDEDSYLITVTVGNGPDAEIFDYDVPFDDLSMDPDYAQDDLDMIIGEIESDM